MTFVHSNVFLEAAEAGLAQFNHGFEFKFWSDFEIKVVISESSVFVHSNVSVGAGSSSGVTFNVSNFTFLSQFNFVPVGKSGILLKTGNFLFDEN